jgi:histidinol-phosphate aminotransferase
MKLPSSVIAPRKAVRAMAPYSPPSGDRLDKLRLDFNENTVGCSPRVAECLRSQITPERLTIYPSYGPVKETLAAHFQVKPEQFTLTNGTDEAIQLFINTYVDSKDDVLIPRPSYAMYRFYAEVAGATIREVGYVAPKYEFPIDNLLAKINGDTRAILISNPNNPTGTGLPLKTIEQILKSARKAVVLIDEAYFEFSGVTALPWIGKYRNLFVTRTFSKVYGMAAMRVGCLFSHQANVDFLRKAQSPYSVNMLAALAAQAAVQDTDYVKNYVAEALAARDMLCAGLAKLAIRYVPSSANFVLANMGARAIEIRDALRGHAILVRDRSYEAPGGVRITVGTREQTGRLLQELEKIW